MVVVAHVGVQLRDARALIEVVHLTTTHTVLARQLVPAAHGQTAALADTARVNRRILPELPVWTLVMLSMPVLVLPGLVVLVLVLMLMLVVLMMQLLQIRELPLLTLGLMLTEIPRLVLVPSWELLRHLLLL